jgi:hypothetical protein
VQTKLSNGVYALKSILCCRSFSRIKITHYSLLPILIYVRVLQAHYRAPSPPPNPLSPLPPTPPSGKKRPRSIIVYLCLIYTRRTPLMQSVGASVRHLPHTACKKGALATSLFLPHDLHLDSVPHPSAKTPDKFFLLQPPPPLSRRANKERAAKTCMGANLLFKFFKCFSGTKSRSGTAGGGGQHALTSG